MSEIAFYQALDLLQSDNPEDHRQAVSVLLECEKNGYIDASYTIGDLYLKGRGVEKSIQKGLEKLKALADYGHIPSLHTLALCKYRGIHLERSIDESLILFNSLTELGDQESNFELAVMYELGQSVPQDIPTALQYYNKVPRYIKSAVFYQARLLLSMDISNSPDQNTHNEGFQLMLELADKNYAPACYEIGYIYYLGNIVPRDFEKAKHYFTIAAKHGITLAYFYIGVFYEFGLLGEKNIEKAIIYYIPPTSIGCTDAQNRLLELNKDIKPPKPTDACTRTFTKSKSSFQHMFECRTCGLYHDCAICIACARNCHAGHDILDIGIVSNYYCSCCDDRKGCCLNHD